MPKSLLRTCCSVVLDGSTLTSRGSLFAVILWCLNLTGLGVSHCYRPHCLLPSRRRHWCLWWRWVVHLTPMIPRMRHEGVVSDPALCPAQFSSEILTRDEGQHWSSSVCLSLLDLGRVSFNCICQRTIDPLISRGQSGWSRRVASQQGFDPPPTCFAVSFAVPGQFSSTVTQDNLH